MSKKNNNKKISVKSSDVSEEDGLKISYDKKELEEKFPSLMAELSEKKKTIEIDSVNFEKIDFKSEAKTVEDEISEKYCEDLSKPGVIDFLRRCTTKEEAIEILDYLLSRNELTPHEHSQIKELITQENGLSRLIQKCGGFKTSGYYIDKFYKKKDLTDNDLNED